MGSQSRLYNPVFHPLMFLFQLMQWLADKVFSPDPPGPRAKLLRPRVAVIGAGITGVTSAAHCIGHGFDVVIFEAGSEEELGGIWSRVNNTSGLQIHSLMYRFHPAVKWQQGYPDRQQILGQVRQLWQRYGLDTRTRFDTRVTSLARDGKGRWLVNADPALGRFDGLVAAVGTCGAPKMPRMPGLDGFGGPVHHSSRLTGQRARGKRIVVVGGGASAVEALEFAAAEGAAKVTILARSDKWIIPRNPAVDALLAMNVFGQETLLSWVPELLLRRLFYRDLEDLAPPPGKGVFTDTPMVNSDVMHQLRAGTAEWVRCDIQGFTETAVVVSRRARGAPPGSPGRREEIEADMLVMATGFERPKLDFLPEDCYDQTYSPPNWYLQTFPPTHPSISCINCTYMNAIGTVGNWHIGIYTRILLMFLVDPLTRPSPFWMRRWIDMTRLLKSTSPVGAFDFFTYLELVWWFVFCVAVNPFRWKWSLFVFFGLGFVLPHHVVELENGIRNGLGMAPAEESSADLGSSI